GHPGQPRIVPHHVELALTLLGRQRLSRIAVARRVDHRFHDDAIELLAHRVLGCLSPFQRRHCHRVPPEIERCSDDRLPGQRLSSFAPELEPPRRIACQAETQATPCPRDCARRASMRGLYSVHEGGVEACTILATFSPARAASWRGSPRCSALC